MLVPVPRELAETLNPCRMSLDENRKLAEQFRQWCDSRGQFNEALARNDGEASRRGWQKDYVLGLDMRGKRFDQHQTRLHLKPFQSAE